jgi:hypothetical protein
MSSRVLQSILVLVLTLTVPASANALWRTVVRLNESRVIYISDGYSYRLRHTSAYSNSQYRSSATSYYDMTKGGWTARTNGTGYINWKFDVDIQQLPSLQSEILDDPRGFVETALREAKNYPIECYIEILMDSVNQYRMQPSITCTNTALGSEPAFAWRSRLSGKTIELQIEY